MCPTNERRRYNVTSLIGWAHTQNDPAALTPKQLERHVYLLNTVTHGAKSLLETMLTYIVKELGYVALTCEGFYKKCLGCESQNCT